MRKSLSIFVIFFTLFLSLGAFTKTQAASISKEIFPGNLRPVFGDHLGDFPTLITYEEQFPLAEVISQSGKNVKKGLEARYEAKTGYHYTIFVGILEMKDKKSAETKVESFIDERKASFAKAWNDPKNNVKGWYKEYEWGKTFFWDVKGHRTTISFASQRGPCNEIGIPTCEFINQGFMATSVENYFIYIQSFFIDHYLPKYINDEAKKTVNVNQAILEYFLSRGFIPLPETKTPAKESKQSTSTSLLDSLKSKLANLFSKKETTPQKETAFSTPTKQKKQPTQKVSQPLSPIPTKRLAECGDKRCDEWAGENCFTCHLDCYHEGNCCEPGEKYTYLSYYHKKIFQLYDPPAGNIPQGYMIVPKGITKEKMFSKDFNSIVCNKEEGLAAECLKDEDCPNGTICNARSCREAIVLEDPQEIIDREWKGIISAQQKELQTEYLHTYTKFKDNLVIHEKGPGLEISLDAQGTRLGSPFPLVSQGEEVNVLLEIKNVSGHRIAIVAGIVYPGHKISSSDLEEKLYSASFEWSGGLSSFLSSLQTKLTGGKNVIMTPGSKFYIQSKIIPQKTGFLKPTAVVYFTSEQYYVDESLGGGFTKVEGKPEEYEKNFQKKEMVKMIEVLKKKCNWWPICS